MARARREKGMIYWGDETSALRERSRLVLRSDDVRGHSYAHRGHTVEVRPCSKRASVNLISPVTSKGELCWMVLDGALKALALIRFMKRLIREVSRKGFLIVDKLPVHHARLVQDWLVERRRHIEGFSGATLALLTRTYPPTARS